MLETGDYKHYISCPLPPRNKPLSLDSIDRLGAAEGDPTQALFVIQRGRVERRRAGHVVDESALGMGDLPATPSDGLDDMDDHHLSKSSAASGAASNAAVELVGEAMDLVAFGTLHTLGEKPSFATTTALTPGVAWRLSAFQLRALFAHEAMARGIAEGLSAEIFRMSEQ